MTTRSRPAGTRVSSGGSQAPSRVAGSTPALPDQPIESALARITVRVGCRRYPKPDGALRVTHVRMITRRSATGYDFVPAPFIGAVPGRHFRELEDGFEISLAPSPLSVELDSVLEVQFERPAPRPAPTTRELF